MMQDTQYAMQGDAVIIRRWGWPDVILDKENLLVSIQNIKNNRASFATEEAYQKQLSLYRGALDFLENK